MRGVTILNEEKVSIVSMILDYALTIVGIVCFAVVAVIGFVDGIIVASVMCLLVAVLFAFLFVANVADRATKYKAKIDRESLDVVWFFDNYKIVESCGNDIYIIEKIKS